MTYTIRYFKVGTETHQHVTRHLVMTNTGWLLKDENHRNIRPFTSVAEAMVWIDEERQGI